MRPDSTEVSTDTDRRRRRRLTAICAAALWGALLPIAALTLDVYQTESVVDDGPVTSSSQTLVEVNGGGVLIMLLAPGAMVAAVGFLLAVGTRWRPAVPIAWALTGVLAVFTLLGMLSIGIFILPVTIALVVACLHAPRA